jgi:hypothetical protein
MKRAFLERLQKIGASRWAVCDWRMILREDYDAGLPYMTECVGRTSRSHTDLETGVRYHVHWQDEQILGLAMKEHRWEADEPIVLTLSDIQMWELDQERISAELAAGAHGAERMTVREAPADPPPRPAPAPGNGRPTVRVTKDFKVLQMPDGREISLAKKWKRRAFLNEVNDWCRTNGTHEFHWQVVVEEYNAAVRRTGATGRDILSDRIDRNLFKGQLDLFTELFEPLDVSGSLLRLKVDFQII